VDQIIDMAIYSNEDSPAFSWEIMYLVQVIQNGRLVDSYHGGFHTQMEFSYTHSSGTLALTSKTEGATGNGDAVDVSGCEDPVVRLTDLTLKGWSLVDVRDNKVVSARNPFCYHTQYPTSANPTFSPSIVPTFSPSVPTTFRPSSLPSAFPSPLSSSFSIRLLSVTLNVLLFDDVSVIGFALTMDTDRQTVSELLEVSISGVDLASSVSRKMFFPSEISFSPSSSYLHIDLTYIPVMSGSYRLNVTLSGPTKDDFSLVFPTGDVLVVREAEVPLPPPCIHRAEFSSDASKVIVTFTSPTNRGGVMNVMACGTLFFSSSLTSHSLPPSARCVWTSDSSLEISSIGSLIEPGDVLKLKSGVWKARCTSKVDSSCSSWESSGSQNVTISVPSVVKVPLVTMSLPREIGPCADLVVDLTSSSGTGGRLWKSVSFMVGGLSPNISSIQTFLSVISSNPSSVRLPVVIPSGLLTSGFTYSLEVKLCNFLGACGFEVKNFVVSSSKIVPVVVLHASADLSLFRNSSLSLSGNAYISVCGGGESRADLQLSWTLSKNNFLSSPIMQSVSVNPKEFKLPSYRLSVGSLYNLTLTAKHSISMKYSSASVNVFIKSGDLVCVLAGGDELGLRIDDSLLLDMSKSYDSNVDPSSSSQPLSFEIRCFQISPLYRDSCVSLVFSSAPPAFSSATILVTSNSSSAVVGDVFQIVMKGRSSKSSEDVRSCEKVFQISILASLSPVVKLELLSGFKMNPSSKLKILGRVDMESSGEVQWSVNDNSIVLSSVSLSPVSQSLPSSPANSPQVLSLVLNRNSLPPQSSFIFTLSCSLTNGYSSSNSVTISTNSPPFGGALEVSPAKGVMLKTLFSMVGLSWVDEDLPLSYQFGYLSSSFGRTVFRSKLELPSASTLLPSVSFYRQQPVNLTCEVIVFDQLDCTSRALFGVSVEEVEMSTDDLTYFLLNGINSFRVDRNPDGMKSFISSTATVLSQVDCSGAPDCDSLNRMRCWSTEGTCGECLDGFLGLFGSSNSPCALRRNHISLSSNVSSSTSPSCDSDADCAEAGWFFECNLQSHLCQS
jgi:hypothetical protein